MCELCGRDATPGKCHKWDLHISKERVGMGRDFRIQARSDIGDDFFKA